MSRQEHVRALIDSLQLPASSFVAYPDHPLLLNGPDLLTVTTGLTAYYVVSQRPGSIIPRALLARLALPPATSHIALVDPSANFAYDNLALFEEVLELQPRGRQRLPTGQINESEAAEYANILRPFHNARYAEAWAVTTNRRHRGRMTSGEPTSAHALTGPRRLSRFTDLERDGHLIFAPPESVEWRRLSPSLTAVTNLATRYDYNISHGVEGLAETADLVLRSDAHLPLHMCPHRRLCSLPSSRMIT